MTPDDLRAQVARVLHESIVAAVKSGQIDIEVHGHGINFEQGLADATMPIIREAQERAWDEGWDASVDAANKCDIAGGDPCGDCAICRPPNPYTERTDR